MQSHMPTSCQGYCYKYFKTVCVCCTYYIVPIKLGSNLKTKPVLIMAKLAYQGASGQKLDVGLSPCATPCALLDVLYHFQVLIMYSACSRLQMMQPVLLQVYCYILPIGKVPCHHLFQPKKVTCQYNFDPGLFC